MSNVSSVSGRSPDIITLEELRKLSDSVIYVSILCERSATRTYTVWTGSWTIQIRPSSTAAECQLVVSASVPRPRRYSALSDLLALLSELGCETVSIPLKAGERCTNERKPRPSESVGLKLVKDD